MATRLNSPPESIEFASEAFSLQHQADRVGLSLGRVGDARREHEHFTLPNRDVAVATLLQDLHAHVTLEHEEELFALLDVIILADIGPTHDHDLRLPFAMHELVAWPATLQDGEQQHSAHDTHKWARVGAE